MRSDKSRLALALYALVAGVAVALGYLRGAPDIYHHPDPLLSLPLWAEVPIGIVVGGLIGFGVVHLSQRAVVDWRWGPSVQLHQGLRHLLGSAHAPLTELDVLVLAGSSAVAEELLFRGWLLPAVGLLVSSLIFGFAHWAPRKKGMLIWIPMAMVMGLALGGTFVVLGGLAAPITAHFVINYRNLHFINSFDPAVASSSPRPSRRASPAP